MSSPPVDWRPLRPYQGDWAPSNPTSQAGDTYPFIPDNSVSNSHIRDMSVTKLQGVGIKVYRSTTQTITTGTETNLGWDTVAVNQGFPAPSGTFTDVTVPFDGFYLIVLNLGWNAVGSGSFRKARLNLNGSGASGGTVGSTFGWSTTPTGVPRHSVVDARRLVAGDTIGATVHHDHGANAAVAAGEEDNALTVVFQFAI